MKKIVLRYAFIAICLLGIVVGMVVLEDFKQESLLEEEIYILDQLMNQNTINEVLLENKIHTYVTDGDYLEVEKSIKAFYQDVYDCYQEINAILEDQKLIQMLTIANFQKDGPEFVTSFSYLDSKQNELEELKDETAILFTEEHIMNYIKEKKLDSYYEKYYHELMFGDEQYQPDDTISKSIKDLLNIMDKMKAVLTFLQENRNGWKIENSQLSFANEDLETEYMRLLNLFLLDDETVTI